MKQTPLSVVSDQVSRNLPHTFLSTESKTPQYRGKVRDVFVNESELLIVTTDRVSVFDQVVGTIPLKGALLTEQSTFWLKKAESVVKTHLIAREDPQIQRCLKADPFRFEIIVRGHLTGSLLRDDSRTRGQDYGLTLDPNIQAFAPFATPIITPTTKAAAGFHDAPISREQIISSNLASRSQLDFICETALSLFSLGCDVARERDLILVDTKYEFGLLGDQVILIDEIHSADSSRYWMLPTYAQRVARGQEPEMLDKERLRRVLIAQGVDPKGSSTIPPLSDDIRSDLAVHYWQLTETLTGEQFIAPAEFASSRVENWLKNQRAL